MGCVRGVSSPIGEPGDAVLECGAEQAARHVHHDNFAEEWEQRDELRPCHRAFWQVVRAQGASVHERYLRQVGSRVSRETKRALRDNAITWAGARLRAAGKALRIGGERALRTFGHTAATRDAAAQKRGTTGAPRRW